MGCSAAWHGDARRPYIVDIHDGGWVIADLDTYEASAMTLAKRTGAIVASVECRHAPEFRFPAAHEDTFAAYKWVLANAASFGGDPLASDGLLLTEKLKAAGDKVTHHLYEGVTHEFFGMDAAVAEAAKAQDVAAADLRAALAAK